MYPYDPVFRFNFSLHKFMRIDPLKWPHWRQSDLETRHLLHLDVSDKQGNLAKIELKFRNCRREMYDRTDLLNLDIRTEIARNISKRVPVVHNKLPFSSVSIHFFSFSMFWSYKMGRRRRKKVLKFLCYIVIIIAFLVSLKRAWVL